MNQLSIVWEPPCDVVAVRKQLAATFDLHFVGVNSIRQCEPAQYTLVDANLNDASVLPVLKEWLNRKPKHGRVICVVDKTSHIETTRAYAIGAHDVVHRPLRRDELLAKIWGDFTGIAKAETEFRPVDAPGVVAAFDALQSVFAAACIGGRLDAATVNAASEQVVSQIGDQGLVSWIATVRQHHSQTYQHCLLVTGVAVAFGQHIGLAHRDRLRLSFAGMLHDLGKARIPVAILEKPGPLDKEERSLMRNHPQYGIDALAAGAELPSEMLDMVLHHHEYLDGSGYPHGLKGGEIADLVRVMTISDMFAALIEQRSYKPPLTGEAAYGILLDMGEKLDRDLVRAFRPVSHLERH